MLGVELEVRAIFEAPTVERFAASLKNTDHRSGYEVLLPLQIDGSRPPLFCVHPAGGLSWPYIRLVRHLGEDQPVYGLQARGISHEADLPQSVEQMAEDYLREIRAVRPSGPYRILGYSSGGLVAQAIATLLQEQGEQVDSLVLIDSYPMSHTESVDERDGSATHPGPIEDHDAASDIERLRRRQIYSGMDDATLVAIGRVWRNNVRIAQRFVPERIAGDLMLFCATASGSSDFIARWKPLVAGDVETHFMPHDHAGIMEPEALSQIGTHLRSIFDERAKAAYRTDRVDDGAGSTREPAATSRRYPS
ncbi:thioesterase domain-containing protein [Rugosimonospora africana]|uniref:thioesterase domain-containing protein n=1 Tax=Rugosimonospora africana TaxID=556532 RepID=UPI0019417D76|nr:alpha/beta fold hydrolase [Rugosimonospora africana]